MDSYIIEEIDMKEEGLFVQASTPLVFSVSLISFMIVTWGGGSWM